MALVTIQGNSQQTIFLGEQAENELTIPMQSVIMQAISNIWLIGPTFDMLILDSSGSILNPMVTDGMLITVVMGNSNKEPKKYKFRCVGSPTYEPSPRGQAIRISSVIDKPNLFYSVCQKSVNGSSSSAIKQLAEDCDLTIGERVDSSQNDTMKWLPTGRKYGFVLGDIAAHGWFGEESAASVVGVTLDGEVVYRDLAKLAKAKPVAHFYYGVDPPKEDKDIAYIAYDMSKEDLFSAGMAQQGYTAKHARFDLDGVLKVVSKINVTNNNETYNIGALVRDTVGTAKVLLGAPDCGNTHENYDRAGYQNARYRATFTRQMSIVTNDMTDNIDLLDPAVIHYIDPKTQEETSVKVVVTSKTVAIVNSFYVERFNFAYQGEDSNTISE